MNMMNYGQFKKQLNVMSRRGKKKKIEKKKISENFV